MDAMTRSESMFRDVQPSGERMAIAVMLCDDHPTFARGLAKLLEDETADVDVVGVATSVEEVERLVRETLPDVVLMDIRMPGTDGIEGTRRVRAASPTTKVVMLTVSDEQSDLYQALRAGAAGYVSKQNDVSEILNAVRSVCKGNLVLPAHLVGEVLHDLEKFDPSALSDTERGILAGIARGETNREIGRRLHVSERTVRRRVEDIYAKLHLSDRIEAAVFAAQRGIGTDSRTDPGR